MDLFVHLKDFVCVTVPALMCMRHVFGSCICLRIDVLSAWCRSFFSQWQMCRAVDFTPTVQHNNLEVRPAFHVCNMCVSVCGKVTLVQLCAPFPCAQYHLWVFFRARKIAQGVAFQHALSMYGHNLHARDLELPVECGQQGPGNSTVASPIYTRQKNETRLDAGRMNIGSLWGLLPEACQDVYLGREFFDSASVILHTWKCTFSHAETRTETCAQYHAQGKQALHGGSLPPCALCCDVTDPVLHAQNLPKFLPDQTVQCTRMW